MELEDITFSSEGEESHEPTPASDPAPGSSDDEPSRGSGSYQPEMDEMLCVLYAHGGMDLPPSSPVVLKSRNKAVIILVVWIRKGPSSLNTYVRSHRSVFWSKDIASSALPAKYVDVSLVRGKYQRPERAHPGCPSYSCELPACTSIPLPLRTSGPPCGM